jgi:long-chain acyl-CoA synthetase
MNATSSAAVVPRSLVDLFQDSVSRHGQRTLFLTKRDDRWHETSYEEFQRIVDLVRGGLAQLGVQPGDRVGIIAANRLEWAAVAYASYGLSAALVPMYESQLERDWAFIIQDANIKVLFASSPAIYAKVAAVCPSLPVQTRLIQIDGGQGTAEMTFADLLKLGERHPLPPRNPASDDVACLMYTSGTTGEPKGVILSHKNIVSNVATLLEIIPVEDDHLTLSFLPWAHAFGHTAELHLVVAGGASMAIAESVDKIVDNLVEVRPTVLVAVPRVFISVYAGVQKTLASKPRAIRWLARRGVAAARKRREGSSLSLGERMIFRLADRLILSKVRQRLGGRLKYAISGAAALPMEVAEFVDGIGVSVYEGYGLTETSPVISTNIPGHRKLGSVGRPLPGVKVVIDRSVIGDFRQGEIVVSGPNVMRGYHNRREETSSVLNSDGALRTGDIGYLDEDGYLFITGRIKEQYKLTNGKYVSPAPLEERLKLSPFVADVMIYGDNRPYNVALIVPDADAVRSWAATAGRGALKPEEQLQDQALLDQIAADIGKVATSFRGYERIAAFTLLPEPFTQENGMLTPSMKLKRRKIVERWRTQIDRLYRSDDTSSPGVWMAAQGSEPTLGLEN